MSIWTCGSKIDHYVLEELIGTFKGFSIWTAVHSLTKQKVTIRVFPRSVLKSEFDKNLFASEKAILKSINSPFIPQTFEVIETPSESFIVKEYIPYNPISQVIKTSGHLPYIIAKKYFIEFVAAVNYLHENDFVVFDDFTTESVLIDDNDHIKIVDYEFFKAGNVPSYHINNKPEMLPITRLNFIAPEILAGGKPTKKADTWCAGVFLFYMCTGELPFKTIDQIYNSCPEFPQTMNLPMRDLINRMLRKDHDNRLSIGEVLQTEWLSKNELIEYCQSFASRSYNNFIDYMILDKMSKIGLNVEFLPQMLQTNEDMYLTSVYRQFHRQTIISNASKDIDLILNRSLHKDDSDVCRKSHSKPNLPILRRTKHGNSAIFVRNQSFKH